MTRRVEVVPLESGYVVKGWAATEAEAAALQAALIGVPKPQAFVPALSKGPAFDSPEHVMPPNCDGFSGYAEDYIGHAPGVGEVLAQAQHEAATDGDDCTSGACLLVRGAGD